MNRSVARLVILAAFLFALLSACEQTQFGATLAIDVEPDDALITVVRQSDGSIVYEGYGDVTLRSLLPGTNRASFMSAGWLAGCWFRGWGFAGGLLGRWRRFQLGWGSVIRLAGWPASWCYTVACRRWAMRAHSCRQGASWGRCRAMCRRARSNQPPSLMRRSRRVATCARARSVPAAASRCSW